MRTDRKIRDRGIRRPFGPADFVSGPASTRRAALGALAAAAVAALGRPAFGQAGETPPERYEVVDPPIQMPDLPFTAADGTTRRMSDWRGRHVLVHFWATWCPICHDETPTVLRLAQILRLAGAADRLGFVLLSIDKNLDAVRAHVAERAYDRAVVFVDPERRLMTALGVIGTPTTMLVDPAGGMIGAAEGRVGWDRDPALAFIRRRVGAAS